MLKNNDLELPTFDNCVKKFKNFDEKFPIIEYDTKNVI